MLVGSDDEHPAVLRSCRPASGSVRIFGAYPARVTPPVVKVLRFDLRQLASAQPGLDRILPPEERAVAPVRRVARAATRLVLAEELGVAPDQVVITRNCEHCGDPEHGRPVVAGAPVAFSVAHSGGTGLLALASGDRRALGVDIEEVRPRRRLEALATRVLTPEEYTRFRAASPEERLRAFLRDWTAKEAFLKAIGTGITRPMRSVVVPAGWSSTEVDVGAEAVAALAIDAPAVQVGVADWSGLSVNDGTQD